MLQSLKRKYRAWVRQRKLNKIRRLILEVTPDRIGKIGEAKSGTVLKVKDVCFSLRHNKVYLQYTKVTRGQVNKLKGGFREI